MIRLVYLRLLLALAFVLGQSFALAHATQHELDGHAKTAVCETCAVSHSGSGPHSAVPKLPPQPSVMAPRPALPERPAIRTLRVGWVCRGPPRLMS
jgi:hypothetical protein